MNDRAEQAARILVVDDDARIRQMLVRYFEQEGYRVSVAADGAAMRAQLSALQFDVVLLDVVLPGDDGLTLAREVRAKSDVDRVSVAADGAAMRAQLSALQFDVVLLDVVLPGDDGLTLAREVRAKSD